MILVGLFLFIFLFILKQGGIAFKPSLEYSFKNFRELSKDMCHRLPGEIKN